MTIKYNNHPEFMKMAFQKAKEAQPELTKKAFLESYKAIVSTIESELAAGNGVKLPRFLRFTPSSRQARTGRNPRTGEKIAIPARFALTVKPSSNLNKIVRDVHKTKYFKIS